MTTLHLLGSARLALKDGKEVKLGAGASLLGYLAKNEGEWVDRRRCALDLYPDEEYEVAGNRLRVALVRLKKLLGDALVADRDQLRLNLDLVEVDVIAVQQALKEISDEIDQKDELERLAGLLPKFRETIVLEGSGLWLLAWQDEWRALCLARLIRLYDLSAEGSQWGLAAESMRAALAQDQTLLANWQRYLRALNESEKLDQGLREIGLAKEAGELSSEDALELRDFCNSVAVPGPDVSNRWTEEEFIALGRMLARGIEDSPEDAATFIVSPGSDGEFNRDRMAYLKFYLELAASEKLSPTREVEVRIRVLEAIHGKENDWKTVIEQSSILLEMELVPKLRSRILFVRSFALFQKRDFDGALSAILEARSISEGSGDSLRAVNCQISEGSFRWHIGEYQKALELYAWGVSELSKVDMPLTRSNISVIWSNTTAVHVILGNWDEAYDSVKNGFRALEIEPNENMLAMFYALVGLVYCQRGEWSKGVDYITDGLRRAYRRRASRDQQISMEWAIGALDFAEMKKDAIALLYWVEAWRKKTEHTRSIAEQKYADRIISGQRISANEKIDPQADVKKVMRYLISRLREAESQARSRNTA